jgi:hypothetical protein
MEDNGCGALLGCFISLLLFIAVGIYLIARGNGDWAIGWFVLTLGVFVLIYNGINRP